MMLTIRRKRFSDMKYGVTPEWTQELELGEWAMEPSSTASKDIVTKAN